jgi:hypothetical protein
MSNLIKSEPVRVYLYGVLLAGLAVLVGVGIVDDATALLYAALGAAVLGIPAVEIARSKVTPVALHPELVLAPPA